MKIRAFLVVFAALMLGSVPAQAQPQSLGCVSAGSAFQVLENFMEAFNARDYEAWYATYHFPHIRISGSGVDTWATPEDLPRNVFTSLVESQGWHHSQWDSREIVQCGPDKVHIAVRFSRFDGENNLIGSYNSLYIVTNKEGVWGIQARSSYAQ